MKRNVKRHAVVQPLDQSYRYIPLTNNQNTIVDVEDYEHLSQWAWYAMKHHTGTFYAARWTYRPKMQVFMHRYLVPAPEGMQIDHISGNSLDNRRANLRVCTHAQNLCNRGPQANCKSGFRGVWKSKNRWRAVVVANRKKKNLGYFSSPEEAYRAYCEAAAEIHGEFSRKEVQNERTQAEASLPRRPTYRSR